MLTLNDGLNDDTRDRYANANIVMRTIALRMGMKRIEWDRRKKRRRELVENRDCRKLDISEMAEKANSETAFSPLITP